MPRGHRPPRSFASTPRCVSLLAAVFVVGCGLLALFGPGLRPASSEPASPVQATGDCLMGGTQDSKDQAIVGEPIGASLTVTATCPGSPIHLLFLVDGSHMGGTQGDATRQSIRSVIAGLKLADNPTTRVAVVEAESPPVTQCGFTNDVGVLDGCIARLGTMGHPDWEASLNQARELLVAERSTVPGQPAHEVIVLVSASPRMDCDRLLRAAYRAKLLGMLLVSVCVGDRCDRQCLRSIASSPRYYFDQIIQAQVILGAITEELAALRFKASAVLSEPMAYIPGSSSAAVDVDGRQLDWEFRDPAGFRVDFSVRANRPGTHPLSQLTVVQVESQAGATGRITLPSSVVIVSLPPTPTADQPSPPTRTSEPSPSPTATVSQRPTPTPTPDSEPARAYLPVAKVPEPGP